MLYCKICGSTKDDDGFCYGAGFDFNSPCYTMKEPIPEPSELPVGYCNCNWIESGESTLPCGCNGRTCTGEARLYRDSVVHWKDKHWNVFCAFMKAQEELEVMKTLGCI